MRPSEGGPVAVKSSANAGGRVCRGHDDREARRVCWLRVSECISGYEGDPGFVDCSPPCHMGVFLEGTFLLLVV